MEVVSRWGLWACVVYAGGGVAWANAFWNTKKTALQPFLDLLNASQGSVSQLATLVSLKMDRLTDLTDTKELFEQAKRLRGASGEAKKEVWDKIKVQVCGNLIVRCYSIALLQCLLGIAMALSPKQETETDTAEEDALSLLPKDEETSGSGLLQNGFLKNLLDSFKVESSQIDNTEVESVCKHFLPDAPLLFCTNTNHSSSTTDQCQCKFFTLRDQVHEAAADIMQHEKLGQKVHSSKIVDLLDEINKKFQAQFHALEYLTPEHTATSPRSSQSLPGWLSFWMPWGNNKANGHRAPMSQQIPEAEPWKRKYWDVVESDHFQELYNCCFRHMWKKMRAQVLTVIDPKGQGEDHQEPLVTSLVKLATVDIIDPFRWTSAGGPPLVGEEEDTDCLYPSVLVQFCKELGERNPQEAKKNKAANTSG
eukprot:TRINITY_DN105785_c0_g1_i1.p1 TRINITY_DN105785_c0_g1~~TRINITY_DN105785_c0_g1_i1.p1  ORF type:complete len:422 (+),score=40.44 TRINITY_DN105785_c0_g1_i1:23-1288(+)